MKRKNIKTYDLGRGLSVCYILIAFILVMIIVSPDSGKFDYLHHPSINQSSLLLTVAAGFYVFYFLCGLLYFPHVYRRVIEGELIDSDIIDLSPLRNYPPMLLVLYAFFSHWRTYSEAGHFALIAGSAAWVYINIILNIHSETKCLFKHKTVMVDAATFMHKDLRALRGEDYHEYESVKIHWPVWGDQSIYTNKNLLSFAKQRAAANLATLERHRAQSVLEEAAGRISLEIVKGLPSHYLY